MDFYIILNVVWEDHVAMCMNQQRIAQANKGGETSTLSNSVRPGKKMACRRSLVRDVAPRMENFDTIIVHIVVGASL